MAKEFYRINVAGLDRDLPLCPLNDKLMIAGFVTRIIMTAPERLAARASTEEDVYAVWIQAVYDAGYAEWILWNSSGNYSKYLSGIEAK